VIKEKILSVFKKKITRERMILKINALAAMLERLSKKSTSIMRREVCHELAIDSKFISSFQMLLEK